MKQVTPSHLQKTSVRPKSLRSMVRMQSMTIQTAPFGFINPNGVFFMFWNLLIAILVIYTIFTLPVVLAFYSTASSVLEDSIYTYTGYIIDVLFFIDIAITFRTGISHELDDDVIVYHPRAIAVKYLKGYFIIDVIANFPLDIIFQILNQQEFPANSAKLLRSLKIVKLVKFARLIKLFRMSKLPTVIAFSFTPTQKKFIVTILWAMIIMHICACAWYGFSELTLDGRLSWVDDALIEYNLTRSDTIYMYIVSLYWVSSTLTSVGFGDIVALHYVEKIIAIIISWIGATIFGFMLGYLSQIVSNVNREKNEYHQRMDSIAAYLRYRKVPKALRFKIEKYFTYYYTKKSVFDETQILNNLSNYLRVELSMFLVSDVLSNIDIFSGINDPSFFAMMITMLHPFSAAAGDIIYYCNEIANEIFIIVKGEISMSSSQGFLISTLGRGSHFGEIDIRRSVDRRKLTAVATTESDLFSLSRKDLIEVCKLFPQINAQIIKSIELRDKIRNNMKKNSKMQKVFDIDGGLVDPRNSIVVSSEQSSPHPFRRISLKAAENIRGALKDSLEEENERKFQEIQRQRLRRSMALVVDEFREISRESSSEAEKNETAITKLITKITRTNSKINFASREIDIKSETKQGDI